MDDIIIIRDDAKETGNLEKYLRTIWSQRFGKPLILSWYGGGMKQTGNLYLLKKIYH